MKTRTGGPIVIRITEMTPAAEELLGLLLDELGPERAQVVFNGASVAGVVSLETVWLYRETLEPMADAIGEGRLTTKHLVHAVACEATWAYQGVSPNGRRQLPPELGSPHMGYRDPTDSTKNRMYAFRADEFVRIIRTSGAINLLVEIVSDQKASDYICRRYAPEKLARILAKLADHLEASYARSVFIV